MMQIAASFVLLAGAGMLLTTLLELQTAQLRLNTSNVLTLNVPVISGRPPEQVTSFYNEVLRRITAFPAWSASRSARSCRGARVARSGRGSSSRSRATPRSTAKRIRAGASARSRPASSIHSACSSERAATSPRPIPRIRKGRHHQREPRPAHVPGADPLNRHVSWTDPVMKFIDMSTEPRRDRGCRGRPRR